MPPLSFIKIMGHMKMASHALKLPATKDSWKQPSGDPGEKHYGDSLSIDQKIAIPKTIPPIFMPQNMNSLHQESCDTVGQALKDFHDDMCDAVMFGLNMWKLQAKYSGLIINSVTAMGSPGCLQGPELESLIKMYPKCASMTGNMGKHRDAVAAGVSKCFKNFQDQVMVPGLPWYPAFAAFPGPMAPPMPNVPMPLIANISAKMADVIAPMQLKTEMVNAFDSGLKDKDPDKQHEALFDGIATAVSMSFLMWLPQQQTMLVMGKGQIPTFAPPFVPVGPVLGGDNIAAPGAHMA